MVNQAILNSEKLHLAELLEAIQRCPAPCRVAKDFGVVLQNYFLSMFRNFRGAAKECA